MECVVCSFVILGPSFVILGPSFVILGPSFVILGLEPRIQCTTTSAGSPAFDGASFVFRHRRRFACLGSGPAMTNGDGSSNVDKSRNVPPPGAAAWCTLLLRDTVQKVLDPEPALRTDEEYDFRSIT